MKKEKKAKTPVKPKVKSPVKQSPKKTPQVKTEEKPSVKATPVMKAEKPGKPDSSSRRTHIIAHSGGNYGPPNSIKNFKGAIADKVDGIELDVSLNRC